MRAPARSAGVVGTARRKGDSGNRGRAVTGEGSGLNLATGDGHGGRRTGAYDRRSRGTPGGGRGPTFGALSKMAGSPTGFIVRHTGSEPTVRGFSTMSNSPVFDGVLRLIANHHDLDRLRSGLKSRSATVSAISRCAILSALEAREALAVACRDSE